MEAELQQLQGTWHVLQILTEDGLVPAKTCQGQRYVFKEGRVTVFWGDNQQVMYSWTVAVNPDRGRGLYSDPGSRVVDRIWLATGLMHKVIVAGSPGVGVLSPDIPFCR